MEKISSMFISLNLSIHSSVSSFLISFPISNNFLDKKFSELEINWEKEINDLLLKKFPKTKYNFQEEKTKAKAINFLQRRGFDFDLSYRQVIGY